MGRVHQDWQSRQFLEIPGNKPKCSRYGRNFRFQNWQLAPEISLNVSNMEKANSVGPVIFFDPKIHGILIFLTPKKRLPKIPKII